MQMDRFLALYWNLLYKDRVTTNTAFSCCFLSKVFAIMLTTLIGLIDTDYSKCTYQCKYSLFHLKSTNIYLDAYPKLVAIGILVAVSMYVIYTIKKLQKKVQPLITLPTVSNIVQAQEEDQQDVNRIMRIDDDPNMFYQVTVDNDQVSIDDQEAYCFNTNNQNFLVAKAALNMNFLTLVLLIAKVPILILAIYFHYGENESYIFWFRIFIPIQALFLSLYHFLNLKKIYNL